MESSGSVSSGLSMGASDPLSGSSTSDLPFTRVVISSVTTGVTLAVGLMAVVEAIVAALTGAVEATAVEATAFEAAVEVEAALGDVGVSVIVLLMDTLGVDADLCWAHSP